MKKLTFLGMSAIALILTASAVKAGNSVPANSNAAVANAGDFMKSSTGVWIGKDTKNSFKLNDKDHSLWKSTDGGKTWNASKDGMWDDKDGKWLKIVSGDLKWSADKGKTWSSVPDWKWQGGDGVWYKFGKDWGLWSKNS